MMRITIARGDMLDSLTTVARGVSSRSTLPILSGILITAQKDSLVMQSTDLEVSVRSRMPANVSEEGSTVVPGRLVSDIIKSLPDAAVSIEADGDGAIIRCEQSVFDLRTLAAEDFPKFPEMEPSEKAVLPGSALAAVARQVGKAVSRDETRPVLTGIYTTIEEGVLRMVATDSYRLAVREAAVEGPPQQLEVVIPGRVMEEVSRMVEGEESVSIGVSENQIAFEFASTEFVSRRIEGTFPNYRQLIPKEKETTVSLQRQELLDAVRRASLLAQHNTPVRLAVSVENATLSVSANTQDIGGARDEMMVTAEGQDVEIAFNHAFLAEGIAACGGDTIRLDVVSPLKPGILTSPDEEGFLYLLMPVRLS